LKKRYALLASTNGSVAKTVHAAAPPGTFRLDLVVADRECGALSFGREHGIPVRLLEHKDAYSLSDGLLDVLLAESIDYVYVFFTRLLVGRLLDAYAERMINFHPSLLPACPGLRGFEDTIESGALVAGSTAHFIENGTDTGKKIIQAFTTTHQKQVGMIRHEVFAQQCATLLDIHERLEQGLPLMPRDRPRCESMDGFVPHVGANASWLYRRIVTRGPQTGNA